MSHKISLISLGCAKNLVNSEQMLHLIDAAGMQFENDPEGADAAILNTCGFIDSAKSEAIENILYLAELKSQGKLGKIIVTGCLPQRYKDELLAEMPEIDAIVGTGSYTEIVDVIEKTLSTDEKVTEFGDINDTYEDGERIVSTSNSWAYIKIAEGCSNCCAFCVIPSLRGKYRSRDMESILAEARDLAKTGIKELIVIAQDITRYGTDNYGKRTLGKLLTELCAIEGIEWIRLHYLYPDELDDELIDVIARNDKILKYLDIPIQHINNDILKNMNRRGTGDEIRELFTKLRERIPGVVLRTSLIAGLPGEGEEEFEQLCEFLKEAKIERAGVFPFSPEEGTPAAEMQRPDEDTAAHRAELIEILQSRVMDEFNAKRKGTIVKVLCCGYDRVSGFYHGRSYAESPDIDGLIWFKGSGVKTDEFYDVLLTDEMDGDMTGEMVCPSGGAK